MAFLKLTPTSNNAYKLLYLEGQEDQPIVHLQKKIRSELRRMGKDDRLLARHKYFIDSQEHEFSSPLINLEPIDQFTNKSDLLEKAANLKEDILSASQGTHYYALFQSIFQCIQVWSDGQGVVFVWGVELPDEDRVSFDIPKKQSGGGGSEGGGGEDSGGEEGGGEDGGGEEVGGEEVGGEQVEEVPGSTRWLRFIRFLKALSWGSILLWILIMLLCLIWLYLFNSCLCNGVSSNRSITSGQLVQNPLPDRLPLNPNDPLPWKEDDVVEDSLLGSFISNRWNVATLSETALFEDFVLKLDQLLDPDSAQFVYWDDLVGRVQFDWFGTGEFDRAQLKRALSSFNVLVWEEKLMSNHQATPNSGAGRAWHLDAIDWTVQGAKNGSSKIAVVDDGFDVDAIRIGNRLTAGINLELRNDVLSGNSKRDHGTHVSSLACTSMGVSSSFHGVSPNAGFVPVQLVDSDEEFFPMSRVVDGILYAARSDVDVINLSLGGVFPYADEFLTLSENEQSEALALLREYTKDERRFWSHLFAALEKEDIVVVIAAGNDGMPIEWDPMHDSAFPVYVTAMEEGGNLAAFSNRRFANEDTLTLVCAPGVGIPAFVPGGTMALKDGTSMAAPLVSGTIAQMLAADSTLTPAAIRAALQSMPMLSNDAGTRLSWQFLFSNFST